MADEIRTKRITEYDEATTFGDNDYIFVDNADLGTRKIKGTTIKQSLATEQQIAAINAAAQDARESIPGTYTELSDEVESVNNSLDYLNEIYSNLIQIVYDKNIVDNSKKTEGYYIKIATGELLPDNAYSCTDYIRVYKDVTYLIRASAGRFAFYDINKKYVSVDFTDLRTIGGTIRGFSDNLNSFYFVSPITGYVRLSTNWNSGNTFMCAIKTVDDDTSGVNIASPEEFYSQIEPVDPKNVRKSIHINSADGINSFYQKMVLAFDNGNYDVHIGKGDYIYTNEFIDSIRSSGKRGVPIGNGCKYYFASGSYVKCEYTGTNASDVVGYFSPLDSQNTGGDFEIYNLNLSAKNVCYALHDEANGSTIPCKHVYRNCYLEIDNTALGSENGNALSKALGGGLGQYEEVIIDNCVFKAINPARTSSVQDDASYHAANDSNITDVKIIVNGCWFENRFRTSNLSNYELIEPFPKIIFTGNSSSSNENIPASWTKLAWNNVIRS